MSLRPTQAGTFTSVKRGLAMNLARLVRTQEQVSSGRRIIRGEGILLLVLYAGYVLSRAL